MDWEELSPPCRWLVWLWDDFWVWFDKERVIEMKAFHSDKTMERIRKRGELLKPVK